MPSIVFRDFGEMSAAVPISQAPASRPEWARNVLPGAGGVIRPAPTDELAFSSGKPRVSRVLTPGGPCPAPLLLEHCSGWADMPDCGGVRFGALFDDETGERWRFRLEDCAKFPLCLEPPTRAPSVTLQNAVPIPERQSPDARAYLYTYVDQFGVETPPSMPSQTFTAYDGSVFRLTFPTPPEGVDCLRVYRTVPGPYAAGASPWRLVAEIDPTTSFVDDRLLKDIENDPLETLENCKPPVGIKGVTDTPPGYAVGYLGATLYFSEVNQPWNWPDRYKLCFDRDICSIFVVGPAIFVFGYGRAWLVRIAQTQDNLSGLPSLATTITEAPFHRIGKVGPRGAAVIGEGLVFVDDGRLQYPIDQMGFLTGVNHPAQQHLGIEFKKFSDGATDIITDDNAFYLNGPNGLARVWAQGDPLRGVMYYDGDYDALFLHPDGRSILGEKNGDLYQLFTGGDSRVWEWRSRELFVPSHMRFSALMIVGRGETHMKLYADGELIFDGDVVSMKPVRFRQPCRAQRFRIHMSGKSTVEQVVISTSVPEIYGDLK